jgi:cytochrome c-type biogenesis protein CcmH
MGISTVSLQSSFWFLAGLLSGVAAALVLLPLWRAFAQKLSRPVLRYAVAMLATIVLGTMVAALYDHVGRPDVIGEPKHALAEAHTGAGDAASAGRGESIEQEAAKLAQRLYKSGGSRDEWLLLAQSYEFLGRTEDASSARSRADNAQAATQTTAASAPVRSDADRKDLERRVASNARDQDAWLGLANLKRQQHDYVGARAAFERVIALKAMTADSWADYADVLGSQAGGSLAGEPAGAIDRALALDPQHPKALWLKASLAHSERHYAAALALWQQLRGVLPADSPDIRIIDSNIAEATQLAGLPTAVAAASAATALTGTVSIDGKLAGRVAAGAVLFIYAKAADSPGPPLAVIRVAAAAWPVSFRLDDSMAMMPSRRLSSFDRVIVEARVSTSGQAIRTPGDLFVVSPVLRLTEGKALKLVISKEVS